MNNILITGVSTGIGYATAKYFLEKGCFVFGSVREKEDADRLSLEFGHNFRPLIFDVTSYNSIDSAFDIVEAEVGDKGLSCLVNNAGIAVFAPMQCVEMDLLKHQFDVNVFANIYITQKFSKLLGASKNNTFPRGKIIVISSVAGVVTRPFLGPYSASKHALEAMYDALRREFMTFGVDVIIVQPGPIRTKIWEKAKNEKINSYIGTDYANIMSKVKVEIDKIKNIGILPNEVAEVIYKAFIVAKSKNRYVVTPKKFMFLMAMYVIPSKVMDNIFFKQLNKLIKINNNK